MSYWQIVSIWVKTLPTKYNCKHTIMDIKQLLYHIFFMANFGFSSPATMLFYVVWTSGMLLCAARWKWNERKFNLSIFPKKNLTRRLTITKEIKHSTLSQNEQHKVTCPLNIFSIQGHASLIALVCTDCTHSIHDPDGVIIPLRWKTSAN